jgi:glycosyltransferase involved in cell wall biosynthesis
VVAGRRHRGGDGGGALSATPVSREIAITVVVPTFNRMERVRICLHSLERQTLPGDAFEVIVVVDGSTDGTVAFLEQYRPPYRFRFLVQDNRGLSAARNRGHAAAAGGLILCLDDDMVAAPALLAEHVRAHAGEEDLLVQGGLELHPAVERTPFIRYDEELRRRFAREKSAPGATLDGEDVSGGNISLGKALLDQAGGFNEGLHGLRNTDGELAYRLGRRGVRIVYRHAALARMIHTNDLDQSLHAAVLYGRSYVFTQRQEPESIWKLNPLVAGGGSPLAALARRFYLRPRRVWGKAGLERRLRALCDRAERIGLTVLAEPLYRLLLDLHFWKGVHAESGGRLEDYLPRCVPILCYHNVSDVKRWRFRHYILPVKTFTRQVRWLKDNGFTALSLDALRDYLERGTPLPTRPVVITFDDGYRDLKSWASPILAAAGFRHTHFLTTGRLGGVTDWVETAPDLPLLTPDDVREMTARHGDRVDFQAHGENHTSMDGLDRERARSEVQRSVAAIEALTGQPVGYLAYPFGDYDEHTAGRMRELGLKASFTVDRGLVRPGQDLQLLPRVEVFANDFWFDFRLKVRFGFSPLASLRIAAGTTIETLRAAAFGPPPSTDRSRASVPPGSAPSR